MNEAPLTPSAEGMLLQVEVTPGAAEDSFPAGYNPWRERIQARVKAQAQQGQANQALCELVAGHLGVKAVDVTVVRGQTSRQKTLLVRGATEAAVREHLAEVLDP